jgi:three-Cys-motif partner protein
MKPPEYYRRKEQTYLKHYFLENYLETVAFHIGYSHREFVYVDCFSGPWRATDEELADTSIRIALDTLNYVRNGLVERGRSANIQAIFIEKDPASFTALQQALRNHSHSIKTTALSGKFEDNVGRILELVGSTFAFFFIDPRGWTGFAMENIRPILRHQPGEVMVNFMYDFINRFINYPQAANELSLDNVFATPDWRKIRDAEDREAASVELYIDQLRKTGRYSYVTSTRVLKPLQDRAYFHLVYATRSPKGIRKFRDVEEKTAREQDAIREAAKREDREERTRQGELPFPPSREPSAAFTHERTLQLQKAEDLIFELLKHGPQPFEQLEPRILELPLVWHSDLNSMIVRYSKAGRITIEGLEPRQRSVKSGNILRLTRQEPG